MDKSTMGVVFDSATVVFFATNQQQLFKNISICLVDKGELKLYGVNTYMTHSKQNVL